MKGLVLIPAFNEEKVIASVLKKIPLNIGKIKLEKVVINDGSTDETGMVVKRLKVPLLTHQINRGLGAALGTGFLYAREKGYDFLITLDADGQHDPSEIDKLVKPIIEKRADFVVGTRFGRRGMPLSRNLVTFFASLATFFFTGVWTSDSQSGYRVFSKRAIEELNIEADRMEVSSEFFEKARVKKLIIKEIKIKPIYTEYSFSKGQKLSNSFNVVAKLAFQKLLK